jgi:hypothetical protein
VRDTAAGEQCEWAAGCLVPGLVQGANDGFLAGRATPGVKSMPGHSAPQQVQPCQFSLANSASPARPRHKRKSPRQRGRSGGLWMDGQKDQMLKQQIGLELSLAGGILLPEPASVNRKALGKPTGSNGTGTNRRAAPTASKRRHTRIIAWASVAEGEMRRRRA